MKRAQVESLWGLIETLRKRIDGPYREDLVGSERLTRYALVDPLLREMGWDTGDPAQLRPEYTQREGERVGKADYALFKNGQDKAVARKDGQKVPAVVVEAKPLGRFGGRGDQDQIHLEGLENVLAAAAQAMRYCNEDNISYFAVTDGRRWYVYETNKKADLPNKRIKSFDLKDDWALADCLSAAVLWRCNPNPPGTERVVDGGDPLDSDGYELTPGGRRKQKDGEPLPPYPPGAMRRLDRTFFLSREGFVLNSDGKQNKQHRGKHPLGTKQVGRQGCCKSEGRVEERERRGQMLL